MNESAELAVKNQIQQFMDFIKDEKSQQSLLRNQILDLSKENKKLKSEIRNEEMKRKIHTCQECLQVKKQLRQC